MRGNRTPALQGDSMNATKRKQPVKAQESKKGTVRYAVISPLAMLALLGEAWASGYVAAMQKPRNRKAKAK